MEEINLNDLKKSQTIYVDGSLSPYGGSVACFKYSDGTHKLLELPPQKDSLEIEYNALISLLKEIRDKSKTKGFIIVTDCLNIYDDVKGNQSTGKPQLLNKTLNLMDQVNVELIWKPRNRNPAGKILERRINCMRIRRRYLRRNNIPIEINKNIF